MKILIRIVAFCLGMAIALPTWATSTIDPTQPPNGAPYTSAPIRNNFQAGYNDVNALQNMNSGATAPLSPSVNALWMNTSTSPWTLNIWDGAAWVAQGTLDPITHVWSSFGGTQVIGVVDTNAALKSLALPAGVTVRRLGFATLNDSPAVDYTMSGSACSLNSGLGDNGYQVKTATSCAIGNMPSVSDVSIWGADLSGATDSSGAVQSAVSAFCGGLIKSGKIFLPAGTYTLGTGITVPCAGVDVGGGLYGKSIINYSATTAFTFQPTSWLTLTRRALPVGNQIHDLVMTTSTANSSRAIEMDGQTGCVIRNIQLTGSQSYNGIRLYGDYKCSLENVTTGYYISPQNTYVELLGDLSGVCDPNLPNCSGPPYNCTLGNCSTRTDVTKLSNVDSSGNNGDGILIHNMVFDTVGEHIQIENRTFALRTLCDSGFADITYCPQEINFTDFESEGATNMNIKLVDSSDFHCFGCYAMGNGASIGLSLDTSNYTGEAGVEWVGGRIFGQSSHCVFIRRWQNVKIADASIYDCNTGAVSGYGIAISDSSKNINISDAQLCTFQNVTPSTMGGIIAVATASDVSISSPLYYGCSGNYGLENDSSTPLSVRESNPNPPPAVGVVSAISGCGSTCAVASVAGNEYDGALAITPGGSAITAVASFTLSMLQPLYSKAKCHFDPVSDGASTTGVWQVTAGAASIPSGATSVTVTATNALTNFTSGSNYNLYYHCSGY